MKMKSSVKWLVVLAGLSLLFVSICSGSEYCRFYEHPNGSGSYLSGEPGHTGKIERRWNDKISSVWVQEGYSVTICEHQDMGGKTHTLHGRKEGSLYNLKDIGFDDQISSYSVQKDSGDPDSGTVCKFYEHPDGRGAHLRSGPGDKPVIEARWNDRITSVWIQGGYSVTIYEHSDFGGSSKALEGGGDGTLYNLTNIGFDDKISSYSVHRGKGRSDDKNTVCRFYEHPNGNGAHLKSGADDKPRIEGRWNDRISSVWVQDGYSVTICEHSDYGGRSHTLYGRSGGTLFNLQDVGFDDSITSYSVKRERERQPDDPGTACRLYEHPDGRGAYLKSGAGEVSDIERGWNDRISSVWVKEGYSVRIYEHPGLEGRHYALYGRKGGTLYNLGKMGFDDRISSFSIKESGNRISDEEKKKPSDKEKPRDKSDRADDKPVCKFYEHANGEGKVMRSTLGKKRGLKKKWDDRISSVRIKNGYEVTIYDSPELRGEQRILYGKKGGALYNMADMGFDDRISSFSVKESRNRISGEKKKKDKPRVKSDRADDKPVCKFYEDAGGKGKMIKSPPGNSLYLKKKWDDKISSVWVRNGYKVTVYDSPELEGEKRILYGKKGGALYNMADVEFDNRVSSYVVESQ
ncbi:peptidase inhibitor family I36 protein [Desulfococcaceae bacterium HSG8]|nr:peptidase inhibitor family I36 protein [Desulfococcaceae bacterium HSG8]